MGVFRFARCVRVDSRRHLRPDTSPGFVLPFDFSQSESQSSNCHGEIDELEVAICVVQDEEGSPEVKASTEEDVYNTAEAVIIEGNVHDENNEMDEVDEIEGTFNEPSKTHHDICKKESRDSQIRRTGAVYVVDEKDEVGEVEDADSDDERYERNGIEVSEMERKNNELVSEKEDVNSDSYDLLESDNETNKTKEYPPNVQESKKRLAVINDDSCNSHMHENTCYLGVANADISEKIEPPTVVNNYVDGIMKKKVKASPIGPILQPAKQTNGKKAQPRKTNSGEDGRKDVQTDTCNTASDIETVCSLFKDTRGKKNPKEKKVKRWSKKVQQDVRTRVGESCVYYNCNFVFSCESS